MNEMAKLVAGNITGQDMADEVPVNMANWLEGRGAPRKLEGKN